MFKLFIIILSLFLVSCATSFKKKTLLGMAAGFAGGYAVGSAATPEGDNKQMHGALYGAAASSLVAAGMIYLFDDSKELKQKKKIQLMTEEIENLKKNRKRADAGVLNPSINDLPNDLKALISPGNWKLYEIDEWVKKGNTLIHQDKELNFEPSKLK